MLHTGLCSVTFRKLSAKEIVDLVARAGLEGVEWGGDVHCPHGDVRVAEQVRKMTADAGLASAAYGSYYKTADSEGQGLKFDSVLKSAVALGTPIIRVWAGGRGSADADAAYRQSAVEDSRRIAGLAAKEGIAISYEFHRKTLTDTVESALKLLKDADRPNVRTYWQHGMKQSSEQRLAELKAVLPWLTNLHVYYYKADGPSDQFPLSEGRQEWMRFLSSAASVGGDRYALLEFVPGGTAESFLQDAAELKEWAGEVNGAGKA